MTSHAQLVQQQVYAGDRDRFLASLFAPEAERRALMALYAYSLELARVRDSVSEPLPGEIRLQWWRDLVGGAAAGGGRSHPVADELLWAKETYRLPAAALSAMSEARIFDLYDDPMPSLLDLEGYCGETVSALFQLACLVLNRGEEAGTAEVAGHAGVAYGLCALMRALPFHAARGQMYLPKDLLARHGVDPKTVLRGETTPELIAALSEVRQHARHHLKRVREKVAGLPVSLKPAFLPLALVEPSLRKLERPGHDPLKAAADLSPLRRQWILWRASKSRRAGI